MKRLVTLPFLLLALGLSGCISGDRTLDPAGDYRSDRILYTADQVIDGGFSALHAFVATEAAYREGLRQWPEVKQAADYVRANVRQWRDDVFLARDAYAATRSEADRGKLQRALAVVRAALATYAALQQRHPTLRPGTP